MVQCVWTGAYTKRIPLVIYPQVAGHPNVHLYESLRTLVHSFNGYFLESDPCLVCSDADMVFHYPITHPLHYLAAMDIRSNSGSSNLFRQWVLNVSLLFPLSNRSQSPLGFHNQIFTFQVFIRPRGLNGWRLCGERTFQKYPTRLQRCPRASKDILEAARRLNFPA